MMAHRLDGSEVQEFVADVTAAEVFLAAGGTCGLKASGRPEVGAILSARPASAAGTFTTNKVKAAPVLVCQEVLHRAGGSARAVVFNSGNANAATGARGLECARRMQQIFASGPGAAYGVRPDEVFVASTGVIGVQLDMAKLEAGITALTPARDGGSTAIEAMMTTDTVPKAAAARFSLDAAASHPGTSPDPNSGDQTRQVTVAGIAKGA